MEGRLAIAQQGEELRLYMPSRAEQSDIIHCGADVLWASNPGEPAMS
jgi:hypothetical protein